MEIEDLEKLFSYLENSSEPFVNKIDAKIQIGYNQAFENVNNQLTKKCKNVFFIDKDEFIKSIRYGFENGAKVFKIHFIKESNTSEVNIGFSFSAIEDNDLNNDLKDDLNFYFIVLQDGKLDLINNKDTFQKYKNFYINNELKEISTYTKKQNTEIIKYKIDEVIKYMIKNLLSESFNVTKLMINLFIFKDSKELTDRLCVSAHTVVEDDPLHNYLVSIGYDFGTVYP